MLRRLKFGHRVILLVLLAAAALVIVTVVTLISGRENTRQLTGIETQYVPLIELDGSLKRQYLEIARTLEDAAGAGEPSKIDDADRMSHEFRERVAAASDVITDNGADPKALDAKFVAYYTVARDVSSSVAGGAQFQQLGDKIEAMRRAQRELSTELDTATSPNRTKLAAAFAAARKSQATSLRLDIVVATIALVLMAVLSLWIIRRTIRSLHAVSEGVERLAHGEFGRTIDVPGGDELGDLAREANRTAERLRDYREESEREAWIETGIAELARRTAGAQSVDALAKSAMSHLAAYTNGATADIFVGDERGDFHLVASTDNGDPAVDRTKLAAFAGKPSVATHTADQRIRAIEPYETAVPLSHDGRTLGVLLLGSTEAPSDKTLDLLGRVSGLIGVALRVAESRERLHALLLQTQRQARAAEAANKELETFSYSVSHDLRAPLRGIDGFSQALGELEEAKLSEDGKNYLRRIRAAAQRMGELIDDLLNLSRVSRADFRRDQVDLSALAETVVAELRRAHPERKVDVVIQPGITAQADARLARIALENLVGNAWKFTSKTPDARIEFGTSEDGVQSVYFVRDNGAGFDMKYADRLFGAFQRLHMEKDYPGTGIGLATVQRVIVRHGGRIWVEAAVGEGAKFQFTLSDRA